MSFFDQPYFALSKRTISRIGLWPEQSQYVRIIQRMAILVSFITLFVPLLIRLHDIWGDVSISINCITHVLFGIILFTCVLHATLKSNELKISQLKVMLDEIEKHWKMFKNPSANIILSKYAERGQNLTTIFTIYSCTAMSFYLAILLAPIIVDFVHPVNETKPRVYLYESEYGLDPKRCHWFIFVHCCVATLMPVAGCIASEAMYILLIVHACALFEVVEFYLKLTMDRCMEIKKDFVIIRNDCNYRIICNCIVVHKEAISFVDQIESIYSECAAVMVVAAVMLITLTGIETLINLEDPIMLMRTVNYTFAVILNLFINSIPGQQVIDRSLKIHTHAYELDWYNMSVKAQKLLILIMIRSNKPCILTAGKIYILSMEGFASVIQIAMSYFTVFAQML